MKLDFIPQDSESQRLLNVYLRNKDQGLFRGTERIVDELLKTVYNTADIYYYRLPSAQAKFYAAILASLIVVNGMTTPGSIENAALMILEPSPHLKPDMTVTHLYVAGLVSRYIRR